MGITVAPVLNDKTAQVAKYLESDLVYHQIEYIVQVWSKLGLPEENLTNQLVALVYDVNARRHGGPLDLSDVNWQILTDRYIEMFGQNNTCDYRR